MTLTQNEINDVKSNYAWVKEAIKFFEQNPDINHVSALVSEMEYAIEYLKPLLKELQEKQ